MRSLAYDEDEGIIGLDGVGVQYPTVFPSREIYVFGDGRRVFADELDDLVVEQWEAEEDGDLDSESYSLEELSDLISPHLTKGTIELVAVANEKNRYAYYDGSSFVQMVRRNGIAIFGCFQWPWVVGHGRHGRLPSEAQETHGEKCRVGGQRSGKNDK